ncbi:uncharacterized protein EDB91DRAFT_1286028 [Suillus paluster]|uniref:uncharacterized protein n=1 Tax=Suillus paluster TaxID=48578 RepID=UPI001B8827DD|nr:uncharacterized protein EDB91DRAFT_1286028 [Suillus paluster]KAG1753647.1 hypothetical protein EDB91DRAFT_1286028 [Suillus paluster]
MVNTTTTAGLISVVLLVRQGDITEYYQNLNTFNATQAYITPLESQREFELGRFLRNIYLNPVRADAGGADVVFGSAYALLQGLYPSTKKSEMTLGNGQTCNLWSFGKLLLLRAGWIANASAFKNMTIAVEPFLTAPKPYLGSVSDDLTNIIYDHVNVQYAHNKACYKTLPATFLEQARHYANCVQNNVFTDSYGIGTIAIRTLFPEIFWALGNMTQPSNKVKISIQDVDYQPFISLFNVTNAIMTVPDIAGIDSEFRQLKMFGNTSIALNSSIHHLAWTAINSTINWCFACNQTVLRGCSDFDYGNDPFLHPGT